MATVAQVAVNRLNAQASTGPKTEEGKATAAQNATAHGLSSTRFALLPFEDAAEFQTLLNGLEGEHQPATPTESFLVLELARSEWKIRRVNAIEAEILSGEGAGDWAAVAARFTADASAEQALLKLNRYEQSARRAWHQALNQLLKLRTAAQNAAARAAAARRKDQEAMLEAFLEAPIPLPAPRKAPEMPKCETKPMPIHLQRELDAHKRRDPLFDPRMDRSQMSKELQKYFDRLG
jgi:hypothetical protein